MKKTFAYIVLAALLTITMLAEKAHGLDVNIDQIPRVGDKVAGKTVATPDSLFAQISVVNDEGEHISGLASLNGWVGRGDISESGQRIVDIWQPTLSYFPFDAKKEPAQDLYEGTHSPHFREITSNNPVPTSTMLVLDISNSIDSVSLDSAKQGIRSFINKMRPGVDRAGILRFWRKYTASDIQPFTSDTTLLNSFVDKTSKEFGSPIIRALTDALQLTEQEKSSRKSIIIYTDGIRDPGDQALFDHKNVIRRAKEANINIHVIAIGEERDTALLTEIASHTRGRYYDQAKFAQFPEIYAGLAVATQNYYILGFSLPDTVPSCISPQDSFELNVAVNLKNTTAKSAETFIVNDPDYGKTIDLLVSKEASKERFIFDNKVTFSLIITNAGPDTASDITVVDTLSSLFTISEWSKKPDIKQDNILQWKIDRLAPGENTRINYAAFVPFESTVSAGSLFSHSRAFTRCYESPVESHSVQLSDPADLSVELSVSSDSFSVQLESLNDTTWYAKTGDSYSYSVRIQNKSHVAAENVTLLEKLPFYLNTDVAGDTLVTDIGALAALRDTTLHFRAALSDTIPYNMFPLIHSVRVIASNEHSNTVADNADSLTVLAVKNPSLFYADLSISQLVTADSTQIVDGMTRYYAALDQVFTFTLKIENNGSADAENVVITDHLPRYLFPIAKSIEASGGQANVKDYYIRWYLDTIPAHSARDINFAVVVTNKLPVGLDRLTNNVTVTATNENHVNNNKSALTLPVFQPRQSCDLFTLDVNVFEPDRGYDLGINFELDDHKTIRFDIYDMSGFRISTLYENMFYAGINRCEWDGTLDNGQQIGSGVYVITLLSDDGTLQCRKKVVVRR